MVTEEGSKKPTRGDKTQLYLYNQPTMNKHHNQPTMTATRWSSCSNNQGCALARVGLILLLLAILGHAQVDPEVDAKCVTRYKDFQDDHAECSYLWNGYDDRFESKQSENKESVPSLSFLCEERKVGARGVYRDDGSDDDFETVFYSAFPECNALETHYGRRLVGEWDGTTATGTFSLVNDTTTTATITVSGTLEIFGVVPPGSETRPAIDGGHTAGGGYNDNGHIVFEVTGDATILVLSNLTIRNGYVSNF